MRKNLYGCPLMMKITWKLWAVGKNHLFFNFDISTQMSIIVDDKSKVENLIESFDYSEDEDDEDDEEINFFKDTGFDCSNSTKTTFIGVFEPDLKALIKYKSIIEDITEDLVIPP